MQITLDIYFDFLLMLDQDHKVQITVIYSLLGIFPKLMWFSVQTPSALSCLSVSDSVISFGPNPDSRPERRNRNVYTGRRPHGVAGPTCTMADGAGKPSCSNC